MRWRRAALLVLRCRLVSKIALTIVPPVALRSSDSLDLVNDHLLDLLGGHCRVPQPKLHLIDNALPSAFARAQLMLAARLRPPSGRGPRPLPRRADRASRGSRPTEGSSACRHVFPILRWFCSCVRHTWYAGKAVPYRVRRCIDVRGTILSEVKPIRNEADCEVALTEVERLWGARSGTPEGRSVRYPGDLDRRLRERAPPERSS